MDGMTFARLLGLPKLVRAIIAALTAAVMFVMPGRVFFTTQEKAAIYMLPGDDVFSAEPGENWTLGFGCSVLTPEDLTADNYYIAGYNNDNPAKGVLDDLYARAVYLDDNTGRGGVILCAVDCVGISRADINDIRRLVIESGHIPTLRSVNVCATHTHAGIDTQGLWGRKFYTDGKNKGYMNALKEKAAAAILEAFDNRKPGNLYLGACVADGMQADVRTPIDFSPVLTRLRFAPADGGRETYLINFAAHAELLGKHNDKISADYPAYLGKEIEEQTGGSFLFMNGAIGGMISAAEIDEVYNNDAFDCEAYTMSYGKELGRIALGIENETLVTPLINIKTTPVKVLCDNTMLVLARFLGVLNNDIEKTADHLKAYILSEVSYMELGDKQMGVFLIPGELYPELADGNFLSAEEAANGTSADYKTLSEMTECERYCVIGLCNDELGYIIPDNDFMLHEWLPYFNIPHDGFGREHYEETNSVGKDTARTILSAMDELIQSAKGASN